MIPKCFFLLLASAAVAASAQVSQNPAKIADPLQSFAATLPYYEFSAIQPWHLTGNYTAYDEHGASEGTGTFELWWDGLHHTRATWQRNAVRVSQWITPDGKLLETGSSKALSSFEAELPAHLTNPLPGKALLNPNHVDVVRETVTEDGEHLRCLMPVSKRTLPGMQKLPIPKLGGAYTWCFDVEQPILRKSYGVGLISTLYDDALLFDGHYIPRHLVARDQSGKRRVELHVTAVTALENAAKSAALVPPADAHPVEQPAKK